MRALVISWEYPPYVVGGMGKHVAELLPELSGRLLCGEPLFIDVLTTRYNGGDSIETINEFITVYRVTTPPIDTRDWYNSVISNNEPLIEAAQSMTKSTPYDLIHVHDWLGGVAGVRLKHEWKVPLLVTIHATERGRHQGYLVSNTSQQIDRLEWLLTFEAWRVIVCSNFMQTEMQNYFYTPLDKIDVIPNGIAASLNGHYSVDELDALHRQYAPQDERLLFFVGRITHEKGVHVLLEAMPHILQQHPNTRLLIAGKNGQKLWPQAFELGVDHAVEFLGYISDEQRNCIYRVVDGAIFPSLYEPFGIVALEAMDQGCSVIASSVGGLTEVVQHQQNGLTCYPNDPQSIAWAVDQLFNHPEAASRWRQRAVNDVNSVFRWRRIADETLKVYERVYQERRETMW